MPLSSNTSPGARPAPSPAFWGARRGKGQRRVVGLVLWVLVGSLLDAVLTLAHLQRGGSEANPLMALALTYGPTAFLGLKMGVSGVGAWVLAAHQQCPLALRGLHGLAVVYGLLLICHVVLHFYVPRWETPLDILTREYPLGRWDAAQQQYEQVIAAGPSARLEAAWFNLGVVQAVRFRQTHDAMVLQSAMAAVQQSATIAAQTSRQQYHTRLEKIAHALEPIAQRPPHACGEGYHTTQDLTALREVASFTEWLHAQQRAVERST